MGIPKLKFTLRSLLALFVFMSALILLIQINSEIPDTWGVVSTSDGINAVVVQGGEIINEAKKYPEHFGYNFIMPQGGLSVGVSRNGHIMMFLSHEDYVNSAAV